MKKIGCFLLLVLTLAASCGKTGPSPFSEGEVPGETGRSTLRVSLDGAVPETKVTGASYSDESRVARWAVWAFDGSGRCARVGHVDAGAAAEIELTLREGTYTLVAVCNYPASGSRAPSLKADVTLTELQNAVFYLGDNAKNALMMYGTATRIVPGEQELSVAIPVRRLVSRVAVNKITVAYANPALTGTTYLRGVYMTNLYRTNRLAEDWPLSSIVTTRSYWYNPAGWHRFEAYDDPTDALVGDRGLNTLLYNNSLPYTTEHVFYAFPNPSPAENDTHEEEWCTRSTRLVVWTEYEGTNYYYLVQLPAMKRNWRYTAQEIKITELGSPDEEYLPTTVDVVWEAEAEGWGDIVYINEES